MFCFSNKIGTFDLVTRRFFQKKGKAASLLNQNRFRHLSLSKIQMIMRPKTRSISLAMLFFFSRLWLSHMPDSMRIMHIQQGTKIRNLKELFVILDGMWHTDERANIFPFSLMLALDS